MSLKLVLGDGDIFSPQYTLCLYHTYCCSKKKKKKKKKKKEGKRNIQETDKTKQAQIEQTYE